MLYKVSKIPFVVSPFYLGYVVFTSDIISCNKAFSFINFRQSSINTYGYYCKQFSFLVNEQEIISIVMLLGIAVIEAYPKVMVDFLVVD